MCSLDDPALWDFAGSAPLRSGDWEAALNEAFSGRPPSTTASATDLLSDLADDRKLVAGVAALCLFCDVNWTGPRSSEVDEEAKTAADVEAVERLSLDGAEPRATTRRPFLLWLATEAFCELSLGDVVIDLRWRLRCNLVHQKILDDLSPSLLTALEEIIKELQTTKTDDVPDVALDILLQLEIHQAYLTYKKLPEAEAQLERIKRSTEFRIGLKGAMGMRTKYQQRAVSQLAADIKMGENEVRPPANETHSGAHLPKPVELHDDVRLENIAYMDIEENCPSELTSIEQMICLNTMQNLSLSQPKDNLADEELFPFLDVLLKQTHGPWAVRMTALLFKCKLEAKHKRTVERAMIQCEDLVAKFSLPDPSAMNRLSCIWGSGMPIIDEFRMQWADLMLSLGLVKSALDVYLALQSWEEVIACYTILELRHKATEIIQKEIEKCPTVKLYCLLGDSTDNPKMYAKAWDFSKQRSSKAQRHWGNFLFSRKKYEECIPHYEKSCEINSLQESVWLRLGFAALMIERYDLAANAYRRYTYLEPNSFEAWNNLAKVYIKQGNKPRAYKALCEAIKYNYDSWQIWDNMSVVSLDTGHFDDVIRSYHRLLDLQKKHLDVEVLNVLVKSILGNTIDADGNGAERLRPKTLELLGRISSVHHSDPTVWELYSYLSPDSVLAGQRLLKSCTILKQKINIHDSEQVDKILSLSKNLGNLSLEADSGKEEKNAAEIRDFLSSVRLMLRSIVAMTSKEADSKHKDRIDELQSIFEKLTERMMNG